MILLRYLHLKILMSHLRFDLDDFLHVADQFGPDNYLHVLHQIGSYDCSIEVGFSVLSFSGLVSVLCLFLLPSHLQLYFFWCIVHIFTTFLSKVFCQSLLHPIHQHMLHFCKHHVLYLDTHDMYKILFLSIIPGATAFTQVTR